MLTTLISREKLSKKFRGKTRENVGVFVKIEFLDKNLTFRIVWVFFPKIIGHDDLSGNPVMLIYIEMVSNHKNSE